ncbi:MAG TPA: AAA domain-containing protein, partial [Gemmataceae bacterium]
PVPPARRDRLDREPVADRPDVELRIHTPPGGVPELAEVVFPAGTPVARAAEYVFKELGELPTPAGVEPRWEDDPDRLAARWRNGSATVADLGGGVRGVLADGPGGWATGGVEFDRAAGWDRDRATDWVRRHAGRHGPGRAVRLETPHRMAAGLAEVVGDLLGLGAYQMPPANGAAPCVEFVPVPGATGNTRPGGAGLETDLADGRQRGRLPPDVDGLPQRGVVNVAEARAVVRVLQQLPADAGPVAVLALSAAQADLIRRLVRGTPGVPADVVVGTPPVLRQREAATVVVSLVRSHTHRAVPFGDEPDWLPLALARGRRRLVLVGDPGTLARRAEWDGPLDHLDGAAARRERDLIHHLVRYLHGRGRFARAFRLCPGTPP